MALQAVPITRNAAAQRPLSPALPQWLGKRIRKWTYVGRASASKSGDTSLEKVTQANGDSLAGLMRAEQAAVAVELRNACPFTSPTVEAFVSTTPTKLLMLAARSAGTVDPARLWTTLLCMAFLRLQKEHFLVEVRGGNNLLLLQHRVLHTALLFGGNTLLLAGPTHSRR